MKKIQKLVEQIEEELESAKNYAEEYLDFKAKAATSSGANSYNSFSSRYKAASEDELKHAMLAHDRAIEEIAVLSKVYSPPAEMEEKWNEAHKKYVEKAAWVKQMLSM